MISSKLQTDVTTNARHEALLTCSATNAESRDPRAVGDRKRVEVPQSRRKVRKTKQLRVVGARENNLKDLTVNFPLGFIMFLSGTP